MALFHGPVTPVNTEAEHKHTYPISYDLHKVVSLKLRHFKLRSSLERTLTHLDNLYTKGYMASSNIQKPLGIASRKIGGVDVTAIGYGAMAIGGLGYGDYDAWVLCYNALGAEPSLDRQGWN